MYTIYSQYGYKVNAMLFVWNKCLLSINIMKCFVIGNNNQVQTRRVGYDVKDIKPTPFCK